MPGESHKGGPAGQEQPKVDYIRVVLNRETGEIGVDSNLRFISDQLGMLEFGKMFISDQYRFAMALQQQKQRAPLIEIPGRPS